MSSTKRVVLPPRAEIVEAAHREVRRLLADEPIRLSHSLAVAECAEAMAPSVRPDDRPRLVAAALLHDIGYAEPLVVTGFHPVDGARHLRRDGWPADLCALVAHHSGARFVARERGESALLDDFVFEQNAVSDALTAADQTIGPDGEAMTVEERMRDMLARHGPDSPQARAHPRRAPYLREAVARVEARLDALGRRGVAVPPPRRKEQA